MGNAVNLDALVSREDFETYTANDDAPVQQTISIRDLERSAFFYLALRKPDFQRETSEWEAKRVAGLVRTFIEGDLIPAVILWKHREYLFVIDGSHRLSALIAWVHDDYGDGERSQKFFGHSIPAEQMEYAKRTRQIVEKEVGSYADHVAAAQNPAPYGPDIVARSRALGSRVLNLQWVRGDAAKAEDSFARINQQAATITPQELQLIKGRRMPDVMAARAIIRRGTGHQYWSSFSNEIQAEIRSIASDTFKLLFEPTLSYPIKSLNLPAGGSVYAAPTLRMVYDFVNISVGAVADEIDTTGQRTVEFLKRARRAAQLVISNAPSSLGLHPAVYFYSWTGKQQPILFLTMADILVDLDRRKKLDEFVKRRASLEKFIINHRTLLNQIVRKFGTKDSGKGHLRSFYEKVFESIGAGKSDADIVDALTSDKAFTYLQPSESPYAGVSPTRYSAQVKSGLVMSGLLEHSPKCAICGGLVPHQAISVDHKQGRAHGGESNPENLQLTHPYCNTGFKEGQRHHEGGDQAWLFGG
ncbi:DUF262 domain-containing protein [Mesorhizobium sp.]|uniref:GmrSD restriction endonuclease domain-containing protein n=1 Tax=Mesorhizobium sp. TaxID=1871066 RepID=UPI0025C55F36|nr:DUF262 domain-containing protein [Mesorhizobium sp.]